MKKYLKKIFCFTILLFVMLLIGTRQVEAKKSRKEIKVGYFSFEGYHMVDQNGKRSGYGYDYLQKMLPFTNWDYKYVGYEEGYGWSDMLSMLDSGKIDLLTSATVTKERLAKFDYSKYAIGSSSTIITVKEGNRKFSTEDYSNWNQMKVGMVNGNSRNDSFSKYAKQHGFSFQSVYFETAEQLTKALSKGSIDATVTSNLRATKHEWVIDQFDTKSFYVIVKKGNKALLDEVNNALAQVNQREPSLGTELYDKYYSVDTADEIFYTRQEQDFIKKCKKNGVTFKALLCGDRDPASFYKNGKWSGYLYDISNQVFKRTGLKFEFVENTSTNEYLKLKKNGKVDVCCDYLSDFSDAENENYVLTDSYYNSTISRITREDKQKNIKKIALLKDGFVTEKVLPTLSKNCKVVYYKTNSECVKAVGDEVVDATYQYTRMAQKEIYSDATNHLVCVTIPGLSAGFSFAINKDDHVLLASILTKAIHAMGEDETSKIVQSYTSYQLSTSNMGQFLYNNPLFVIVAVIFLAVILMIAIILVVQRRKTKEVNLALNQAKNATNAKTMFLSNMSHDMRTPMNAVIGLSNLGMESTSLEESREYLSKIQFAGNELLNLINDTLDVSRIESGKLQMQRENISNRALMEGTLTSIRISAEQKDVNFVVNEIGEVDVFVYVDIQKVQKILQNILSNAIKFTPKGGSVTFDISMKKVDEGVYVVEGVITDTGCGMSPEFIKRIYEPFEQEESSLYMNQSGTGLGMTIVKTMVDFLGGTIEIESKQHAGTKITVELPFLEGKEVVKKEAGRTSYEGKRLLVCEDHPMNQEIIKKLLEKRRFMVDIAADGKIGVQKFLESDIGYYDAILMDIRMPNMDGLETTRVIRVLDREDAKTIPIIAMTANAYEEDIRMSLEAGMNAHVAKPIDVSILYDTLDQYL